MSSLGTSSAAGGEQAAMARIHPGTSIGSVRLTVSDLARAQDFYTRALGLQPSELENGEVGIGIAGEHPLIELHGDPAAPRLNRRATGLYHLAILVPSRRDLAFALARLAEARWPLDGASDHLVSEALYLSDPDGNGIEIYRDRPREEWRYEGPSLSMATLPLNLDSVLGTLAGERELQRQTPAGTRIGHVHLQVSDIAQAEHFYAGVLGFDVTVRGYPGALFVSAGGYHHHIGLNTWHSAGGDPPTPGSVGLRSFDVLLPTSDELARTLERIKAAGLELDHDPAGPVVHDPSGNAVVLRTR